MEDVLDWSVDYFVAVSEFNCFISTYSQGYAVEVSFRAQAGCTVPAIKFVGPAARNVADWGMVANLFKVDFATVRHFSLVGLSK